MSAIMRLPVGVIVGVVIVLIVALLSEALSDRSGQTLYNGIVLPNEWPPEIHHFDREPMPVPYLEDPPAVIPIDVGRQLFVDDFLIEGTTLERKFHKAAWHPATPVLRPDKPWEARYSPPNTAGRAMPFSDGVWYDPEDKLFKMWYLAGADGTCYACSRDGIRWEKPDLDVLPGTNVVLPGKRDSSTVWLDLMTADRRERYKMMRRNNRTEEHEIYYSGDGIHWDSPAAVASPAFDRSTFFYNPFRKVWVLSIRGDAYNPRTETVSEEFAGSEVFAKSDGCGARLPRMRRYAEGQDLPSAARSWPPRQSPTRWWRHPADWASACTPTIWLGADRLDPPRTDTEKTPELYNLDCVAYESLILGLFSIWRSDSPHDPGRGKINNICVGFSRDGFHWDRTSREPILDVSEDTNAWNTANVQSAGGCCLVVGDKLYFYTSGFGRCDTAHGRGTGSTGLGIMRRDGFASMDAAGKEGTLTTRPLRFSGKHLFVNADAAGGELRVEILDRNGSVVEPFSRENCVPVTSNSTLVRVRWHGRDDLTSLAGKPARFRFYLTEGSLYSFWVSPDENGASYGYVAAGGPGFTGPIDTIGAAVGPEQ